jgi:hypothetical protein
VLAFLPVGLETGPFSGCFKDEFFCQLTALASFSSKAAANGEEEQEEGGFGRHRATPLCIAFSENLQQIQESRLDGNFGLQKKGIWTMELHRFHGHPSFH